MHNSTSRVEPDNSHPAQVSKWTGHEEMGFPVRYMCNTNLLPPLTTESGKFVRDAVALFAYNINLPNTKQH